MSASTAPRFSISPYFAAYDPAKPSPVVTKTVERLLSDAGIEFDRIYIYLLKILSYRFFWYLPNIGFSHNWPSFCCSIND